MGRWEHNLGLDGLLKDWMTGRMADLTFTACNNGRIQIHWRALQEEAVRCPPLPPPREVCRALILSF
jgi:hypothetical protein